MRARDNPFSSDRVLSVRYHPQGWDWPALMTRLADLDYRCAIVGPEGRGKTTLLEDLGERLRAEQGFDVKWLRLSREQPRFDRHWLRTSFAGVTRRNVLLFDGAEQMGRLAWWGFLRKTRAARGLIITSHRSGLLPTLARCDTSPELLEAIVRELVGCTERLPVRELFNQYDGNVREALRHLYDLGAESGSVSETTSSLSRYSGRGQG